MSIESKPICTNAFIQTPCLALEKLHQSAVVLISCASHGASCILASTLSTILDTDFILPKSNSFIFGAFG
jgi:hypothetical protein